MNMRIAVAGALLLGAGQAWATACAPGSLADYVGLGGGCDIAAADGGTLHFDNFTTFSGLPPGASPLDLASISVTPLIGTGLGFGFGQVAGAGEFFGLSFGFSVAAARLVGAGVAMDATAAGSGAVSLLQDACASGASTGIGSCSGGPVFLHGLVATADASVLDAASDFASPLISMAFEIGIDGGADGSARLDGLVARFSVPEPATLSLALLSLGMLGGLRRRPPEPPPT